MVIGGGLASSLALGDKSTRARLEASPHWWLHTVVARLTAAALFFFAEENIIYNYGGADIRD